MTITSAGYAGTVGDAQWANMVSRVGSSYYAVDSYASFRVTITSGTRAVSVAAGSASAYGIYDTSDAPITKNLDSVPSGTRWDLVVLRRTWATKSTSVEVIPGGSSKALPARTVNVGTLVDQPLALVRAIAGSTVVQEVVDLRCTVGAGGAFAWDDLALSYLTRPGTSIRIDDTQWTRVYDATGAGKWVSSDMTDTGWVAVTRGTGWTLPTPTGDWYAPMVRRIGQMVFLRGMIRYNASSASIFSMGTVPASFRPAFTTPLGTYHSSSDHIGELTISKAGIIGSIDDYYSNTLPLGAAIPLHGSWVVG